MLVLLGIILTKTVLRDYLHLYLKSNALSSSVAAKTYTGNLQYVLFGKERKKKLHKLT